MLCPMSWKSYASSEPVAKKSFCEPSPDEPSPTRTTVLATNEVPSSRENLYRRHRQVTPCQTGDFGLEICLACVLLVGGCLPAAQDAQTLRRRQMRKQLLRGRTARVPIRLTECVFWRRLTALVGRERTDMMDWRQKSWGRSVMIWPGRSAVLP